MSIPSFQAMCQKSSENFNIRLLYINQFKEFLRRKSSLKPQLGKSVVVEATIPYESVLALLVYSVIQSWSGVKSQTEP